MYLEQFRLDFLSAFQETANLSVTAELKLRDSHRFVVVFNVLFRCCPSNHCENAVRVIIVKTSSDGGRSATYKGF
jgi:hypothetical protein